MRILLFDIDGTLIEVNKAGKKALLDAFTKLSGMDCSKLDISLAGKTDKGVFSAIRNMIDADHLNDNDILREYTVLLSDYLNESGGFILPGVYELLNFICRKDYYVPGLLTGNAYDGARIKLEYFSIFDYFPFGVFGDIHSCRNDLAAHALSRLKHLYGENSFKNEDIFIIGDTPADIECGKSINAKTVAVSTGPTYSWKELEECNPDYICESLEDISSLIRFINRP